MSLRGEAVVHDGGVVVGLTAGLRKPDPPTVGVVGPGGLPALVADLGEGGGGVHPVTFLLGSIANLIKQG